MTLISSFGKLQHLHRCFLLFFSLFFVFQFLAIESPAKSTNQCDGIIVDDYSSYILMIKLHSLLKEGNTVAKALQLSQIWFKSIDHKLINDSEFKFSSFPSKMSLTSEEDFKHPFFWGGFYCTGYHNKKLLFYN